MVTTHQKKWTVRDEILISDALVHELECRAPSPNHAVVEHLCITLPAKRAAVVWKLPWLRRRAHERQRTVQGRRRGVHRRSRRDAPYRPGFA
jgi:hypothetical protein